MFPAARYPGGAAARLDAARRWLAEQGLPIHTTTVGYVRVGLSGGPRPAQRQFNFSDFDGSAGERRAKARRAALEWLQIVRGAVERGRSPAQFLKRTRSPGRPHCNAADLPPRCSINVLEGARVTYRDPDDRFPRTKMFNLRRSPDQAHALRSAQRWLAQIGHPGRVDIVCEVRARRPAGRTHQTKTIYTTAFSGPPAHRRAKAIEAARQWLWDSAPGAVRRHPKN